MQETYIRVKIRKVTHEKERENKNDTHERKSDTCERKSKKKWQLRNLPEEFRICSQ